MVPTPEADDPKQMEANESNFNLDIAPSPPSPMPHHRKSKRSKTAHMEDDEGKSLIPRSKGKVAEKDDEERELESALFGVSFQSASKRLRRELLEERKEDPQSSGLGHVLDNEVSTSSTTGLQLAQIVFPSYSSLTLVNRRVVKLEERMVVKRMQRTCRKLRNSEA